MAKGSKAARKKRRARKAAAFMKKLIPVLVAIVLIVAIVGIFYGKDIYERFTESKERADKFEYFGIAGEDSVALIINEEHSEYVGYEYEGECYLPLDVVRQAFNSNFYYNVDDQVLINTTGKENIVYNVSSGAKSYDVDGSPVSTTFAPAVLKDGELYVSLEYISLFADMTYTEYDDPNHVVIYTKGSKAEEAFATKDTAVRYRGGIKSPILEDLTEGEEVYVLEELDDWTKVLTDEGYIGYVMSKRLNMSGSAYTVDIKSATYTVSIESLTKEEKENVLFVQVMNQASNVAIDDVLGQEAGITSLTSGVKTIAPTWFRILDNEGNIENISDKAYVDKINAYGIDVWGVWTDVDYSVDLGAILRNTSKRNKLVDSIVSDAQAAGLQGVNIDFETLKSDYGQDFVQFIRELSVKTHDAGLILSVDNYVPAAYNSFYGIDQQGVFADYVIIMGYDEHYAGSAEAGSVASIDYVEQGIIQATNVMPANKVINAIPFYTRAWTTAAGEVSSKALGMIEAKEWANANGIALEWDNETCQQYGQIEKGGTLYQIWLEDPESIQVKLSVMQSYEVGGVAEWKAGLEDPVVWGYIEGYLYE